MTPAQREAAERLADWHEAYAWHCDSDATTVPGRDGNRRNVSHREAAALLRELASDQVTEPKNGELWHIRRPGALACVTMEIVEVTPKTLLMKPVRDPFAYPERLLRSDTVLIECAKEHQ